MSDSSSSDNEFFDAELPQSSNDSTLIKRLFIILGMYKHIFYKYNCIFTIKVIIYNNYYN